MLPAIDAYPHAILKAVVSIREEDFRCLPEEVGRCYSVEEMLAGHELDAVYVASPNHLHHEHTVACLEAGLDVLCEKPLARSFSEAEAMVATARRCGRRLITAYDQRHHPAHDLMRQWIAEGRLGIVTQARIDYACWVPSGWSADNWRVDPKRAGGGAIIDLAPHGLDLLETLTGQTITELHCFDQRAAHDYPVDDGGVLCARLSEGALATLTVGYNRPEMLPRRRLEVTGTGGMLLAENTMGQVAGGRLRFCDATDGSVQEVKFDSDTGPFHGLLNHFVTTLREDRTELRDAANDLRLVKLLESATQKNTHPWP
jgi:predicted dehydrogenase